MWTPCCWSETLKPKAVGQRARVSQKTWQMKTLFFPFPPRTLIFVLLWVHFMRHLWVFKGARPSHDFPSRCVGGPSYVSCAMPIESSVIDGNEWRRSENQCPVSKKQSSMPFSRSQRNGPLSQWTPATDSQLRKICPIVGEGQTLFTTVSRRQHSCRQPHWAFLLWLPRMTTTDYINFHPHLILCGFFFVISCPFCLWFWPVCEKQTKSILWGVPDCYYA